MVDTLIGATSLLDAKRWTVTTPLLEQQRTLAFSEASVNICNYIFAIESQTTHLGITKLFKSGSVVKKLSQAFFMLVGTLSSH